MPIDSGKREYTLTVIRALLLSQKGGCTLAQLNTDYYEQEGEGIPWKELGYVSVLNFLQSVPKAIQIDNRGGLIIVKGVATEKSKHISTLIANQKTQPRKHTIGRKTFRPSHYYPKTAPPRVHIPAEVLTSIIGMIENHPDGVNKDYVLSVVQSRMPYSYVSIEDMNEQLHEISHKIYVRDNKMFPARSKAENLANRNQPKESLPGWSVDKEKWGPEVVTASGNEDCDDVLDYDDEDDYVFTPTAYIQHPVPMNKSTKPMPASNFIEETVYKCQGQVPEDHAVNNAPNAQDYNTWHDEYRLTGTDAARVVGEEQNCRNRENLEILISDRTKFRLEQLILKYPDGIWCADLPDKYLEEYKFSLNYTELGFNSVREFTSCLPNIFHSVQPHSTGDFKLYDAKKEIPSNVGREHQKTSALIDLHSICMNDDEVEAIPPTISIESSRILIPDDVMNMGESVGYLSVEDMANEDKQYVEVFVVEVFTPSFFWIQLRKKQNTFKKMMDDLHNFYSSRSNNYTIPPVVLEKGLNCACLYNGVWHRGIIKTVRPDLQVTVMFYDYGTLKTYSSEAIHYLHRGFSFLPAQAIPCGLVNTRPYNERVWTHNATYKFAARTAQIPLIATIASYNSENNSMMITLTDTLEDEDVHINDWLVEQKLAKHGKVVCMKNRNFPFRYYLECKARAKRNNKLSNCLVKDKSEIVNKVASYNSNNRAGSACKVYSVLNEGVIKKLRSVVLRSQSEIGSTSQKNGSNAVISFPKGQRELLYGKLLRLKRKTALTGSSDLTNEEQTPNNIHYIDSSVSSLNLQNKMEINGTNPPNICQEKEEEQFSKTSGQILHQNPESGTFEPRNINDTKNSAVAVKITKHKNLSEPCSAAAKETSSIPLKILNMPFRIRESDEEDERYIRCFATCHDHCDGQHNTRSIDWSAIRRNIAQDKKSAPVPKEQDIIKKMDQRTVTECKNLPSPEICFLRAVRNSAHFAEREQDIRWSPASNIVKIEDPSELLLRQTRFSGNDSQNIKVAMTSEIIDMLSGNTSSGESAIPLGRVSQDENETPSLEVVERINCTIQSSDTNSKTDMPDIKSSQTHVQHSLSSPNNYYACIKVCAPTIKLLKALANQKQGSNDTSDLDSDDFSDSQGSITDSVIRHESGEDFAKESVVDNDSALGIDESIPIKENYMSIDESNPSSIDSLSREFHLDVSSEDCNLNSDDNVPNVLNSEVVSNECTLNDHNRAVIGTTSSELRSEALTDELLNMEESELPIVQATSTHSVKNDQLNNAASMEEGMSVSALVPYNADESIPVFNDIDIESEVDEWDAYASYSQFQELSEKINSRYKGNVPRLDESNNSVQIEEINENEIEERKLMDNCRTEGDKICETREESGKYNVDDLKCEFETVSDQCNKSIESEPPVIYYNKIERTEKENSALTDPVIQPSESHGKRKSLQKMLDKEDSVDLKNLMTYTEENLLRQIFSPDCTYREKAAVPNNDNKLIADKESDNVPLVSPQSTLGDKPLKPPPGLTLPAEPMDLYSIPEETATAVRLESDSTQNPFMQDEQRTLNKYIDNKYIDTITPQRFLELWNRNLKLQMEITAIFNVILNKVIVNTRNGVVHDSFEMGQIENVQQQFKAAVNYLSSNLNLSSNGVSDQKIQPFNTEHTAKSDNAFFLSDKDVPKSTSYSAPNISDAYAFTTPLLGKSYCDSTVLNDTIFPNNNVAIPTSFETPSTPSNGPFSTSAAEYNYFARSNTNSTNYNACDINFTTDGYSNVNPMTKCLNTTTRSDFFESGTNQSVKDVNSSVITNGFGNCDTKAKSFYQNEQISTDQNNYFAGSNNSNNNTFNLEYQHTFANSTKNDPISSFEETKDTFTPFKETNPFKLILAGKLRISETPDECSEQTESLKCPVRKTWESVPDSDLCSSFKTINRNDFEYHKMKIRNANNNSLNSNRSVDILPIDAIPNYSSHGHLFSENLHAANSVEKNGNDPSNRSNSLYASSVDTVTNSHLKGDNKQNTTEHDNWDKCFATQGDVNCTEVPLRSRQRTHEALPCIPSQLDYDLYGSRNGQNDEQSLFTFPQTPFGCADYGAISAESIGTKPLSSISNSNNVTSPSWTPFNSFTSPVVSDNLNIDEGYLTRPPTSHMLQSSSPLESDFPSLNTDSNDSVEALLKSMGNIVINQQPNGPQHNSSQTQPAGKIAEKCSPFATNNLVHENSCLFDEAHQFNGFVEYRQDEREHLVNHQLGDSNNLCANNILESQGNVKDITEQMKLRTDGHESTNRWKAVGSNESTGLDHEILPQSRASSIEKLFFKTIELTKRRMHIFHYEDEGWLLTDEFIEEFTEFQTASYLINLLNALGVRISFQVIERIECPLKFEKLERTLKKTTREAKDKIDKIHLLPLKLVLKVLGQLRIITRQDIDNAIIRKEFVDGSITHDVWLLINGYAEFKRALRFAEQL